MTTFTFVRVRRILIQLPRRVCSCERFVRVFHLDDCTKCFRAFVPRRVTRNYVQFCLYLRERFVVLNGPGRDAVILPEIPQNYLRKILRWSTENCLKCNGGKEERGVAEQTPSHIKKSSQLKSSISNQFSLRVSA